MGGTTVSTLMWRLSVFQQREATAEDLMSRTELSGGLKLVLAIHVDKVLFDILGFEELVFILDSDVVILCGLFGV